MTAWQRIVWFQFRKIIVAFRYCNLGEAFTTTGCPIGELLVQCVNGLINTITQILPVLSCSVKLKL
ncbi:MAG: hypothetical protein OJF59_000317 [Cytophagales bacterium]|nr:MAG: hypothetical protein OJF59_000317 [Cytophagales bacterium]